VTRRGPGAAALVGVAVVLAACSSPEPSTSRGGVEAPPVTAPAGPGPLYVAVGASETAGVGADQPLRDGWPRVLFRTALPPSSSFLNMGIPGATVAQAIREELPTAVELRPSLATVWLNVNDILAGVPVDRFEREMDTLLRGLRGDGATRVLVANVPPLDRLPSYLACRPSPPPGSAPCRLPAAPPPPAVLNQLVEGFNAATARLAERHGAHLVDLHTVGMAARAAGTEATLVSGDGFHPSTAGHAAVAAAFADVLRRTGPLAPPAG
jgi:lysophospholipase L1-like esterase